jgi:hypothetical protein
MESFAVQQLLSLVASGSPQSAEQLPQVSSAAQNPFPQISGHAPQSAGQVEQLSFPEQNPSSH